MLQPRYIDYYRVSTAEQGRSGLGLEAQQAAIKAFLQGRDHDLVESFVEAESGRNSERPRLGEALALARKLKATLVIAKLDRLARSVSFIANLMDAGVSVSQGPSTKENRDFPFCIEWGESRLKAPSLFGFLYVLLSLETYSLMLGSLSLFVVLSIVMALTRRVDWSAPTAP